MDKLVERWVQIPQQQRYLGVGLGIVAVIFLYWYFLHSAYTKDLKTVRNNLRTRSQERTQQVEYVAQLAKYEAKFNQLQQDLNEARSQLPDEADMPQLLAQLDNNARQSGLNIARFEPQSEQPRDFYAEVGVQMQVEGSYHEIGTFVDAVGKMDRIVNVTNIRMEKPRTENSKVVVDGNFFIKTYRFIEEGQRGKKKKK